MVAISCLAKSDRFPASTLYPKASVLDSTDRVSVPSAYMIESPPPRPILLGSLLGREVLRRQRPRSLTWSSRPCASWHAYLPSHRAPPSPCLPPLQPDLRPGPHTCPWAAAHAAASAGNILSLPFSPRSPLFIPSEFGSSSCRQESPSSDPRPGPSPLWCILLDP